MTPSSDTQPRANNLSLCAGENFELRADLNSEYKERRKDAIKRVIANMTVGKDVSGLFPDVLKNMQTEDLEQKKLVYLYLMNYAKTQPELVILAVNTFVKVIIARRIICTGPILNQPDPSSCQPAPLLARRTPTTPILSYGRSRSGQWAVFAQRKSSTTFPIHSKNVCATTIRTFERRQLSAWQSFTISSRSWR